jgi:hypothetical protein
MTITRIDTHPSWPALPLTRVPVDLVDHAEPVRYVWFDGAQRMPCVGNIADLVWTLMDRYGDYDGFPSRYEREVDGLVRGLSYYDDGAWRELRLKLVLLQVDVRVPDATSGLRGCEWEVVVSAWGGQTWRALELTRYWTPTK